MVDEIWESRGDVSQTDLSPKLTGVSRMPSLGVRPLRHQNRISRQSCLSLIFTGRCSRALELCCCADPRALGWAVKAVAYSSSGRVAKAMMLNSRFPSAIFTNRPTPSSIARSLSMSSDSSSAPRSIGSQLPSSCRNISNMVWREETRQIRGWHLPPTSGHRSPL